MSAHREQGLYTDCMLSVVWQQASVRIGTCYEAQQCKAPNLPTTSPTHTPITRSPDGMPHVYSPAGPSGSGHSFELLVKYPGFWRTLLRDGYWSAPASEISRRGQYEKKLATDAMNLADLPAQEKELLNVAVKAFSKAKRDYRAAVNEKDKKTARKRVKLMEESLRALHNRHANATGVARTIVLHRAEQEKIKEAYIFIASKYSEDLILMRSTRASPKSVVVIPPEVALHTMAWLNEGHLTKRIHWLRGPRRCGKSVILKRMMSTCKELARSNGMNPAWVAGIAFDRPYDNEAFVAHFLPTVIHEIANEFHTVKQEFSRISACWDHETYFRETEFGEQVTDIFVALASVIPRGGRSPIIIALDGLENCDSVALDKLFEFVHKCLDSPLPIYFIVAASEVGRTPSYMKRAGLQNLVDINDVPDLRDVSRDLSGPSRKKPSGSRSDAISEVTDSGISV